MHIDSKVTEHFLIDLTQERWSDIDMDFRETDSEEVSWNVAVHSEVYCVCFVVMEIDCWLRQQDDI
jgi:hypothetical protein